MAFFILKGQKDVDNGIPSEKSGMYISKLFEMVMMEVGQADKYF